jgi:hypothetical protein
VSLDWEIHFEGMDAFNAALPELMPVALMRAAEHTRGVAVERTPIEEGDLRQSAGTRMVGDEAWIEYNSVYARRQHYELDWRHPRGGQALFLESAVVTEEAANQRIMADTFREAT